MSESSNGNSVNLQPQPQVVTGEHQPPAPTSDIADAFHLFRDYLDYKLIDLKSDLASEQDKLSKQIKEEAGIKFKKEGNGIQYRFNEEILGGLLKVHKYVIDSASVGIVSELISKLKARNKLIRIADSSAGGWATAKEYQSNVIADDSDDEKKIRQAEGRALKSFKEKSKPRPSPYNRPIQTPVETAPNPAYSQLYSRHQPMQPFRAATGRRAPSAWDMCHQCKQFGHWRKNCPFNKFQQGTSNNAQGQAGQRF